MSLHRSAVYLLRIGIAFAFAYPAIDAISNPFSWMAYFPAFVRALPIDPLILLHIFGAFEIILAVWILSGWRVYIPSVIGAAVLLAIVVFNPTQFEVLFRDIPIAIAALALATLTYPFPHAAEMR